jgi:hypothetical protein
MTLDVEMFDSEVACPSDSMLVRLIAIFMQDVNLQSI